MASGTLGPDDHNGPAFMVRPAGKYLAQWTGHNANYLSYFRVFDGNTWGPQTNFNWTTVGAAGQEQASYSNPHYLPAENRAYTFVRAMDNRSPHILVSTNYGDTWSYYGKLVRPSTNFSVGYNPGYFRYSDNGVDRIDFICTEAHPRDYTTSIYHGYISNSMSFKTDGTVVDSNLNDTNCLFSYSFTPVFTNGTILPPGMTNYRCWNDDVQRFADGTIECIISARINQNVSYGYPDDNRINPNHSFFFCRYDGTKWTPKYLCQAGTRLYLSEADYVGLGCLSPNDPNTIYISTQYDPRAPSSPESLTPIRNTRPPTRFGRVSPLTTGRFSRGRPLHRTRFVTTFARLCRCGTGIILLCFGSAVVPRELRLGADL